jgi:hypothetical protein
MNSRQLSFLPKCEYSQLAYIDIEACLKFVWIIKMSNNGSVVHSSVTHVILKFLSSLDIIDGTEGTMILKL